MNDSTLTLATPPSLTATCPNELFSRDQSFGKRVESRMRFRVPVLAVVIGLLAATPLAAWAETTNAWLMLYKPAEETVLVTDPAEQKRLSADGWATQAKFALNRDGAGRSPLHRMAKQIDDRWHRLLTARADEVQHAISDGFHDEGVMGHVALNAQPGLAPVKRFKKDGRYLWLANDNDLKWAQQAGWELVGEDFWVWPAKK